MRAVQFILALTCVLSFYGCSPSVPDALTDEPPPSESTPDAPQPTTNPDAPAATVDTATTDSAALTPTHTPAARLLLIGAAPSPDGQLVALVDDRGTQVHRVGSFEVLWRAPLADLSTDLRDNQVQIVWTPDSQFVTVTISHEIYGSGVALAFATYLSRFDARTGELRWQHTFPNMPTVWFAPDGNHMVVVPTNHSNEEIKPPEIWDAETQSQTGTLELPERGMVWWLLKENWSPDGSMIAGTIGISGIVTHLPSGGMSADHVFHPNIYVWDAVTGKQIANMNHPHQAMNHQKFVGWSRDGTRLISAEEDCFIFWDTSTWAYRYEILTDPKYNGAGHITLSPDGSRLLAFLYYITTYPDTTTPGFGWWNTQNLQEMPVDPNLQAVLPEARDTHLLGWQPDGHTVIYTIAGRVMAFDTQHGTVTQRFVLPAPDTTAWWQTPNRGNYCLLSPDAEYIYGMEPTSLAVYNADTGDVLYRLED